MLDATVGLGGHGGALLEKAGPSGFLIGIDRDPQALETARGRLENEFGGQVKLIHGNFGELGRILQEVSAPALDAALFDLGVSSLQLDAPQRGFSFNREGPLDMRMDPAEPLTASDLVNHASRTGLEEILRGYGEERFAGRIARAIVTARPLRSTEALARTVRAAVPAWRGRYRIDPATRTFQALRIAVNRELEVIEPALEAACGRLQVGGRVAVLAYHSLEDRIVKRFFRQRARSGVLRLLTPKPVRPSQEETAANPRARSARLRAAERIGAGGSDSMAGARCERERG